MVGHDKGLKVAMIMYEDNARLINDTLAAIAPNAELHTIPLGRVDAMLALRRWLEDGGLGGMLADRTLPGNNPQRSKTVVLPFLGAPARFADGPFRLAALLRRKVVFMAGLYRGGNRYDLRFSPLADFSAAASAGERDALIGVALARYVETLEALCREAPYNWFNFFDFWAEADADARTPSLSAVAACAGRAALLARPGRGRRGGAGARPPGFDLRAAHRAARPRQVGRGDLHREAPRSRCSTAPSSRRAGSSFRAPDTFIRETLKPRREKLEVTGNMLTMSLGERSRTVQLDSAPEAAVIVEAMRGTLTGNRESLERLFDSQRLRQRRALVAGARAARPAAARPGRVGAGQRPRADGARSPGAARRRRPLDDDDRAAARRRAMSRPHAGDAGGTARSCRAP